MADKTFILHADDGTVYKVSQADLQKHKVADDDPNLSGYKAKAKHGGEDACAFIAVAD